MSAPEKKSKDGWFGFREAIVCFVCSASVVGGRRGVFEARWVLGRRGYCIFIVWAMRQAKMAQSERFVVRVGFRCCTAHSMLRRTRVSLARF